MFAMLSDQTYFNDKLSLFIACAPIVYLDHVEDEQMQNIAQNWLSFYIGTQVLGLYEFTENIEEDNPEFCNENAESCTYFVNELTGTSEYSDPAARELQNKITKYSASTKQITHFGQGIKSGQFKQFDYGTFWDNINRYGTSKVPSINLKNVPTTIPIALLVGK